MSDRFKFRFWDKEKEKMLYKVYVSQEAFIVSDSNNPLLLLDKGYTSYNPKYAFKYLMQCTGLKDKNGKFIYEGDVLKHIDPKDEQRVFYFQLLWRHFGFNLEDERHNASEVFHKAIFELGQSSFEIIGNIYKNPELLKEK